MGQHLSNNGSVFKISVFFNSRCLCAFYGCSFTDDVVIITTKKTGHDQKCRIALDLGYPVLIQIVLNININGKKCVGCSVKLKFLVKTASYKSYDMIGVQGVKLIHPVKITRRLEVEATPATAHRYFTSSENFVYRG